MTHERQIHVVGAVIVRDRRVLAAQRGPAMSLPGLWEFPGGKIEAGEPPEAALRREIREELGVEIRVGDSVVTTTHKYELAVVELSTYYAEVTDGQPIAAEHSELRWCDANELKSLEWAPADVPAVHRVLADLTSH